jgi:hypothetical protein
VEDDAGRIAGATQNLGDGAVAHGDQEEIGVESFDRLARDVEQLRQFRLRLGAEPDAVDRPSDAAPRAAVCPRRATAA